MAEITPLLRTSGHTCQGNGLRTAHSGSHCAHFIAVAPLMKTTLGDAQHKSQHWRLTGLLLVPARTRRSAGPMCYPVCSFVLLGGILQPPPFWCGGKSSLC